MTNDEFTVIVDQVMTRCTNVLLKKGIEYSGTVDRLENFKRAGALQGIHPAKALLGMLTKHFVSVAMYIETGSGSIDSLEEKLTDIINYCILLEALLKEK